MALPEFIKNEPIAVVGLIIAIVLGAFSSPILVDWYAGPNLTAVINYSAADDGRCLPSRVVISNSGKSTASNVRIHFQVDYFSKRGDINSYYTGNEPFYNIVQNVDYIPDCCKSPRCLKSGTEGLEQFEGMQQFVFQLVVAIHGQDQFSGWANDATGALDDGATKCFDFTETPKRRTFGRSSTSTRGQLNL